MKLLQLTILIGGMTLLIFGVAACLNAEAWSMEVYDKSNWVPNTLLAPTPNPTVERFWIGSGIVSATLGATLLAWVFRTTNRKSPKQ